MIVPGDPLSQFLPPYRLGQSMNWSILLLLLNLILFLLVFVKVYVIIDELRI
jgi:hypothetical protein